MLKKFMIVCTCICLVMALFNIPQDLSYEVVRDSIENVGNHSQFLTENFAKVGLLTNVVPDYMGLESGQSIKISLTEENTEDGIPDNDIYYLTYFFAESVPDTNITQSQYDGYKCLVVNSDGHYDSIEHESCPSTDTWIVIKEVSYAFRTEEMREEVYNLIIPFLTAPQTPEQNTIFDVISDFFNSSLYIMYVGFALIEILIYMVFGFIYICWDLLYAFFRIIGIV